MMMTMEEKGISYNKNLLDEQKMPDWYDALLICSHALSACGFPGQRLATADSAIPTLPPSMSMSHGVHRIKDVCDGNKQIPFMKENETGKWLYDSDKMAPYLEDKFPDLKKIGKPDECPQV